MPILSVERLKSFDVYDRQGEKIGSVRDVIVDMDDGRVQYALVGTGGFLAALGIQDKLLAIPCEAFRVGPDRLTLGLDRDRLRDAPAFSPYQPPEFNRDYESTVLRYYGLTPYWERRSYRLADRQAGDFLSRDVPTFHPNTPIGDVAGALARSGNAAAPVVDDQGRFVGMVTASDLAAITAGLGHRGEQRHSTRPQASPGGSPQQQWEQTRTPEQEMIEPSGMLNARTTEEMPVHPEAARRERGVYEEERPSWEEPPERPARPQPPQQRYTEERHDVRPPQSPSPEHRDRGDEDIRRRSA